MVEILAVISNNALLHSARKMELEKFYMAVPPNKMFSVNKPCYVRLGDYEITF